MAYSLLILWKNTPKLKNTLNTIQKYIPISASIYLEAWAKTRVSRGENMITFEKQVIGKSRQKQDEDGPSIWLGNSIDGRNRTLHLNVDQPQNIAIIAPSGTGKTNLLSTIAEGLQLRCVSKIKSFNWGCPLIIMDLLGNMHGIKKLILIQSLCRK